MFVSVTEELLVQLDILSLLNLFSQVQLNKYQVYLTRNVFVLNHHKIISTCPFKFSQLNILGWPRHYFFFKFECFFSDSEGLFLRGLK